MAKSSRTLRALITAIPVIYLVPALLLASGFNLSESFYDLRMHEVDKFILSIKISGLVGISVLFCILGSISVRPSKTIKSNRNRGLWLAILFFIVGSISLHIYAGEIGGYYEMLTTVLIYKSGAEPTFTALSFLKTLSTIASAAYLIFTDIATKRRSLKMIILAFLCFLVGGAAIFIQGGRLSMIIYIAPITIILPRPIKIAAVCLSPIILLYLLNPDRSFFSPNKEIAIDYYELFRSIISDLSPGMANVYWLRLDDINSYRWFKDVPLVLLAFMPKRILNFEYKGESTAMFELVGFPNAADLIGFGILSASILGVILWSYIYGCLLSVVSRCIDRLSESGYSLSAFGLMIYFAFRPMYFSPQHFLFTFIPYIYLLLIAQGLSFSARSRSINKCSPLKSNN